ncbi:MAG: hypothetical protein ACJAUD_002901 [Crocinitomicaceae bacterium]|jgi:hypothetical protein
MKIEDFPNLYPKQNIRQAPRRVAGRYMALCTMRYFLIILTVFPFLSFGQTNPTIERTANKLTGIWLLERYERDSLVRTQEITANKFVEKTFIFGELTKKEESDGGYVIELSFDPNGQGSYDERNDYRIEPLDVPIVISTCQSVPELLIENNKVYIRLISMAGEETESIVDLTVNSLELLNNYGIRRTFKRIN